MANNIGWGLGVLNNTINWGLGAVNNGIGWGISHIDSVSWSGETELYGVSFFVKNYNDRVIADGGVIESLICVDENLNISSNPIITLLGDVFAESLIGTNYVDAGATAFDEFFFGDITGSIVTTSNVNENNVGVYNVKYNVEDLSGSAASEVIRDVYIKSVLVDRYESRISIDGGVVESKKCIDENSFAKLNWQYYFRVIDDLGVVEKLECVTI